MEDLLSTIKEIMLKSNDKMSICDIQMLKGYTLSLMVDYGIIADLDFNVPKEEECDGLIKPKYQTHIQK